MDSGASCHLFKNESAFIYWDTTFNPKNVSIVLADGSICSGVKGKGTIKIEVEVHDIHNKPHKIRLNEVLFYPSCGHTGIISVHRAMDEQIEFPLHERKFFHDQQWDSNTTKQYATVPCELCQEFISC